MAASPTFQAQDPNFAERIRDSFNRQGVMDYIGATMVDVRPGYVEIHLPHKPQLAQQHGFFHAGMIGTIADSAGGYAAYTLMPADASVLTVEYKLNLLRPADGDLLIARAHVIKAGRTLTVCRADVDAVKNGESKLCATMQLTLMTMHGMSDNPQV